VSEWCYAMGMTGRESSREGFYTKDSGTSGRGIAPVADGG